MKERWPKGPRYAFQSPNIIQLVLGRLLRLGGDQIIITPFCPDQDWFPEIMCPAIEPTEKVQAITMAPMVCNNIGSNSKGDEKHPTDCLEAHIPICAQSGIREKTARKVTDSWTKGTKQSYKQMFEQLCSVYHKRWLPVLKICVNNLVEYLDYLQVTHDYAYMTPSMHASAICRILQPTEQKRVSIAPLVKLFKRVFKKKPPTRVWADTWDVKKVIDLLHAWGKSLVLNYTHLTLKTVMSLARPWFKRLSDLNLLRIIQTLCI